ncbi:MAG: 50S ribosomal protein L23 [bacterium]
MAIFGTKKVNSKKEQYASQRSRIHHARAAKLQDGIAHEIIHAPWFSEKSLIMTEKGVYTFEIPKRASKSDVAGAIKEIYNVKPRSIRIVNLPGKKKAMRTKRGIGTRATRRKAYVYLNSGDTIQFS